MCAQLEAEQGRPVGAGDLPQLRELAQRLCQEQGLEPAAVDEQLLEAYATCPGGERRASCACQPFGVLCHCQHCCRCRSSSAQSGS